MFKFTILKTEPASLRPAVFVSFGNLKFGFVSYFGIRISSLTQLFTYEHVKSRSGNKPAL